MHVPEKIEPGNLADYLEIMSKSVFQSGISWRVVESKWPGVREAMRGFDPQTVAAFADPELDDLAQDSRMIRHRRKLSAISANARKDAGPGSRARHIPGLPALPRQLRRYPAGHSQGVQVHGRLRDLPLPLHRWRRGPTLRGVVRHPRAQGALG